MRAWWMGLVVVATACGGSSEDDGAGGTGGTGGTAASGGASGSGANGGSAGSGASGGASGGAGGSAATGGSAGVGGSAGASVGGSAGASGSAGSAGSSGTNCNPSDVQCDGPTPQCPPGQVASVQGTCWGGCVPILECATIADCTQCQSGFCAAYQGFTTEYRCVMPTVTCAALACSCLAQYLCADPYYACDTGTGSGVDVNCACPAC